MKLADEAAISQPSRRKSALARYRWVAVAALLLVAALPIMVHIRARAGNQHGEAIAPPTPAVSDEIAQAFLDSTHPGGIVNRNTVAGIIADALQAYFADHGEYPAYLFGGGAIIAKSFTDSSPENVTPNPDPLISGGYLDEYPRVWYLGSWPRNSGDDGTSDPRGWDHWNCMFSTPGDLLVFSRQCIYLTEQYLFLFNDDAYSEQHANLSGDLGDRVPLDQRRHFALGGLPKYGNRVFSAWPSGEVDPGEDMECLTGDLSCFGYQRGEWLGLDEQECWLWFYGNRKAYEEYSTAPATRDGVKRLLAGYSAGIQEFIEQHSDEPVNEFGLPHSLFARYNPFVINEPSGLDLINAKTGELAPDGIPDGICLLYKLKDGEVVEVVPAEGI